MNALHRVAIHCAVPALLLLLVALRPIPALAEDKCTAGTPQLDQVVTPEVSLGKRLTLHLTGLAETACDLSAIRLRLDGYTFGNQPELDDLQNREIAFSLERLDADRSGWTRILGAPPLRGIKEIAVSLELPDKSVLPHVGRTMPTVRFVIFTGWQLIGGLLLAAVLLMIVFVMAHHTGLLRDTDATITDPKQRTFSLGRCQMAFWFVLLTVGFVAIWVITWDYVGILTPQSLVLLGISGATALGAISIDASKPTPAKPLQHTTFWNDILTDANGPVLQRLQVLIWTLVLGVISIFSIYRSLSLPAFEDTLLAMTGISSGLYVGFKWPEKPT